MALPPGSANPAASAVAAVLAVSVAAAVTVPFAWHLGLHACCACNSSCLACCTCCSWLKHAVGAHWLDSFCRSMPLQPLQLIQLLPPVYRGRHLPDPAAACTNGFVGQCCLLPSQPCWTAQGNKWRIGYPSHEGMHLEAKQYQCKGTEKQVF